MRNGATARANRTTLMLAVVDAGPLYAVADADDDDHARCVDVLERGDLELVVPALVVAEVTYLVGRRLGPGAEAAFLRALASVEVEAPLAEEWASIAQLVDRYADFPLGGTDASVAVLADRLGTDLIVTLDRRHFGTLRTSAGDPFRLLPEGDSTG
jgi:predicted nucleic acid-binding protein